MPNVLSKEQRESVKGILAKLGDLGDANDPQVKSMIGELENMIRKDNSPAGIDRATSLLSSMVDQRRRAAAEKIKADEKRAKDAAGTTTDAAGTTTGTTTRTGLSWRKVAAGKDSETETTDESPVYDESGKQLMYNESPVVVPKGTYAEVVAAGKDAAGVVVRVKVTLDAADVTKDRAVRRLLLGVVQLPGSVVPKESYAKSSSAEESNGRGYDDDPVLTTALDSVLVVTGRNVLKTDANNYVAPQRSMINWINAELDVMTAGVILATRIKNNYNAVVAAGEAEGKAVVVVTDNDPAIKNDVLMLRRLWSPLQNATESMIDAGVLTRLKAKT